MNTSKKDIQLINIIESGEENTPNWSMARHLTEDALSLYYTEGDVSQLRNLKILVPKGVIYFQFNLNGDSRLQFSPHYGQGLEASESMLLYNPSMDLDFTCSLSKGTQAVFIVTSVHVLHRILVDGSEEIHFLNEQNIDQKYYLKSKLSPNLKLTAEQLFSAKLGSVAMRLYRSGKTYELLSHFFHRDEQSGYIERCPFLKDQRNVEAIRQSRQILMDRMSSPPTIKELSLEVGLNEYQLKLGFKNIYGNSINAYLQEHRINKALKLMTDDGLKVQEAAHEIGYTNVSHFIAAFKKKHGITPKQYMMG